jgi:hypothetical protein
VRRVLLVAALVLGVVAPRARAICTVLPAKGMNILIPNFGDAGSVWAPCLKYDLQVFASSAGVAGSTNVWTGDQLMNRLYVNQIGGRDGGSGVAFSSNVYLLPGLALTLQGTSTATIKGWDATGYSLSLAGRVKGVGADWTGGVSATTASFTGGNNTTPSVTLSSGASVGSTLSVTGPVVVTNGGNNVYSVYASSGGSFGGPIKLSDGTLLYSTAAFAGSGTGAGAVIVDSGSVSGSTVGVLAGQINPATTFYFDSAGFNLYQDKASSATIIQVKNLTFVASTETYPSGTLAASSSAGPCFSASTATWTQGNNKALFCFSGSAIQSAGGFAALSFLIDGQFPDGLTATKGVPLQTSGATGSAVSFCWLTKNALSAGAHNACLTGLTNGNTLTIPNATTLNTLAQFSVQELATGGAGYSAPASSFTVVAPGSYTNTTFAAAITTVTINVQGGVMDIWGLGSWSSSGNGNALGILVDGMYISTTSGQTAYGQQTVFGTISEDKNMGVVNNTPVGGNYSINMSFPAIRVSGLSSGSHSVALTLKTDATMTLPPVNYPNVKYYFGASEVRNAAGTGDVGSNGNTNFSGNNTFSGTNSVGPTVYSTTASYTSTFNGECPVVAYSSFTAAAGVTITGISSAAYVHILEIEAVKNTAGTIKLTVNGDTGAHYYQVNRGINTGASAVSNVAAAQAYYDAVACHTSAPDATTNFSSTFKVMNAPRLHNDVKFVGAGRYSYNAAAPSTSDVGCYGLNGRYIGTAPLTSISIVNSAGTITGYMTLRACPSGLTP